MVNRVIWWLADTYACIKLGLVIGRDCRTSEDVNSILEYIMDIDPSVPQIINGKTWLVIKSNHFHLRVWNKNKYCSWLSIGYWRVDTKLVKWDDMMPSPSVMLDFKHWLEREVKTRQRIPPNKRC